MGDPPDTVQPLIGDTILGIVEHRLDGTDVTSAVIAPHGIVDLVIGRERPSPFEP